VRAGTRVYAAGPYPQRLGKEAELRDNIARSTVPVKDIGYPLQIHATDDMKVTSNGVYQRKELRRGVAKVRPDVARGYALIHELGHHASHESGTTHSAYDTDAKRGQEEAYADDYAAQHYRTRRGKPQPVGDYAGGRAASTHGDGRSVHFWNAYEKYRQTGAGTERRAERREANRGQAVPGQLKGQEPLLHKVTTSSSTGTSAPDWDYALGERRKDR
jgi:hypothetical protein